jgi:transposase
MSDRRCFSDKEKRMEAMAVITEKGYGIDGASRNLGIVYSVPRHRKMQLADDPQNSFLGKGIRHPDDRRLKNLQRDLERVKEERDTIKNTLANFVEDQK